VRRLSNDFPSEWHPLTLLCPVTGQLWALATATIQGRLRVQLNTALFAKTLARKDIASSAPSPSSKDNVEGEPQKQDAKEDENDSSFSSKAQIMNLMTTDVDRIGDFAWHFFSIIDGPLEIVIASILLYSLLGQFQGLCWRHHILSVVQTGISSFFGLAALGVLLPITNLAAKTFFNVEENLMKARDERMALMNEILGAIRMLKVLLLSLTACLPFSCVIAQFMAWERSFERKVMDIRDKELKFQARRYSIEVFWNFIFTATPILVTLVAFWHYAVIRQQPLTPSVAFTSVGLNRLATYRHIAHLVSQLIVFADLKYAMNVLPEDIIKILQVCTTFRIPTPTDHLRLIVLGLCPAN
jgi:hypothetical protein